MKKTKLNLILVFSVLGICFVVFLVYLSLLGENHKINNLVINFFETVKKQNYAEINRAFSADKRNEFANEMESSKFILLFELSLLKKYNLIEHNDYKVRLKRSHLWIPYIRDDTVFVSILLEEKGSGSLWDIISNGKDGDLIENVLSVQREDGTWKIKNINIYNTSISEIFRELKSHLEFDKFVKRTPNGFLLNTFEVNAKKITPIEKRVLKFILHQVAWLIDNM